MREPNLRGALDELNRQLRDEMLAFGAMVRARRPDVRFTVDQHPSIHYASTTLLGLSWDKGGDDLVVAGAVLDLRSGSPIWSIDIVQGDGAPIAEHSVSPEVASQMLANPSTARREVGTFLASKFDDVLAALPHVTLADAD